MTCKAGLEKVGKDGKLGKSSVEYVCVDCLVTQKDRAFWTPYTLLHYLTPILVCIIDTFTCHSRFNWKLIRKLKFQDKKMPKNVESWHKSIGNVFSKALEWFFFSGNVWAEKLKSSMQLGCKVQPLFQGLLTGINVLIHLWLMYWCIQH